ncbi:MAG: helix-turn-helix domain-containing protein [Mesotoga sp.]|nr:helix-turn-helix domain-containing protein [Mesotoga sp.]
MIEIEGRKYYTAKEAAAMLNLTTPTITRWIREKRLKGVKLGKSYLIPAESIKGILEGNGDK